VVNLHKLLDWHIQSQEMLLHISYTVLTADLKHRTVVLLSAEGIVYVFFQF